MPQRREERITIRKLTKYRDITHTPQHLICLRHTCRIIPYFVRVIWNLYNAVCSVNYFILPKRTVIVFIGYSKKPGNNIAYFSFFCRPENNFVLLCTATVCVLNHRKSGNNMSYFSLLIDFYQ